MTCAGDEAWEAQGITMKLDKIGLQANCSAEEKPYRHSMLDQNCLYTCEKHRNDVAKKSDGLLRPGYSLREGVGGHRDTTHAKTQYFL